MSEIASSARLRAMVGGIAGFVFFAVDAVATVIRFVFNPAVAERATLGAALAMLVFFVVSIAAGALAGALWSLRWRLARFVLIGALIGAVAWSYLTATWTITARPSVNAPPTMSVPAAVTLGAGAGACGGLLLYLLSALRTWREKR